MNPICVSWFSVHDQWRIQFLFHILQNSSFLRILYICICMVCKQIFFCLRINTSGKFCFLAFFPCSHFFWLFRFFILNICYLLGCSICVGNIFHIIKRFPIHSRRWYSKKHSQYSSQNLISFFHIHLSIFLLIRSLFATASIPLHGFPFQLFFDTIR